MGDARHHDHPRSCSHSWGRKNAEPQQLGRSRGGWGLQIHAVCDGLGHPVTFIRTAGQVHDITQAEPLLEGLTAEQVIADKGYDGDKVIEAIEKSGAERESVPPTAFNSPKGSCRHCSFHRTSSRSSR